jgi:DNA-binding protein HU-beta
MGRAPGCDAADYEDASSRAAALGCAQDLAVLIEVVRLPGEVSQQDGQGNVHLRPPLDWFLRTGRYSRRRPHSHGPRNLGRTNISGIVPCRHDPSPAGQQATSENMNNQKSVGAIASAVSTSKSAAGETVDAFIALVSKAVVEGEGVQLVGFGTFSLGQRAARTGRNPRTGDTLQLLLPQLSNSRRERRSRTS